MKTKYLSICIALLAVFLVSCGQKKREASTPLIENGMVLTANDTVQVMELVTKFMDALKEKRYADAVMMLHETDPESPYSKAELLNNDKIQKAMEGLKRFPVQDYQIKDYWFKTAYDNEVKCMIEVEPESSDETPLKLNFSLKPVRYFGEWSLCLRD